MTKEERGNIRYEIAVNMENLGTLNIAAYQIETLTERLKQRVRELELELKPIPDENQDCVFEVGMICDIQARWGMTCIGYVEGCPAYWISDTHLKPGQKFKLVGEGASYVQNNHYFEVVDNRWVFK